MPTRVVQVYIYKNIDELENSFIPCDIICLYLYMKHDLSRCSLAFSILKRKSKWAAILSVNYSEESIVIIIICQFQSYLKDIEISAIKSCDNAIIL